LFGKLSRHYTFGRYDLPGLIAHELGHLAGIVERNKEYNDKDEHHIVWDIENSYHRLQQQTLNCYGLKLGVGY
jgi:hypothetical protein